jgi:hypothetical protein
MLAAHGSRTLGTVVALMSLLFFEGASPAAPNADAEGTCPARLDVATANAAMAPLYEAFQLVDSAFNSGPAGLTPSYIAKLGYFVDRTNVIAYGPFQQVGPLGPGATEAIGVQEASELQAIFEGGLKAAYGPQTTLVHRVPVVSSVMQADRRAMVNSRADVFDASHRLVAIVRGLAQYYIPCASGEVPAIEWIHFTLQIVSTPEN